MQPKTKLQHRVVELSQTLPSVTAEQKTWGIINCLSHVAYRTTNKTNCMDCGHTWATKGSNDAKCICPSCNTKLTVQATKQRVFAQREFYSIITTVKDFQVVRLFEIRSFHKTGSPVKADMIEICSQWILADGTFEYIARLRGGMGFYSDTFSGYLEIRGKDSFERKFNIYPTKIYPTTKLLPVFKRNGVTKKHHYLTPFDIFRNVNNPMFETLLKSNETWLLQAYVTGRKEAVIKYWNSVKVAMRNNYKFTKANVKNWFDYIVMLDRFGKDLNSAHYVCPADLKKEHDRLIAKQRVIDAKIRLEQQKAQLIQDQIAYTEAKKAYFGICFGNENITIKVLASVEEFIEESKILHHCVYGAKYYEQANSLILSARIDGKPVETIEFDLVKMQIAQARGLQNKASAHNGIIKKLVKENIPLIRKIKKSIKPNKQAA